MKFKFGSSFLIGLFLISCFLIVAPNADICFPKNEENAHFATGMRILIDTAILLIWKRTYRTTIRHITIREKCVQINCPGFNKLLFVFPE